jgi:hypothetical protein
VPLARRQRDKLRSRAAGRGGCPVFCRAFFKGAYNANEGPEESVPTEAESEVDSPVEAGRGREQNQTGGDFGALSYAP